MSHFGNIGTSGFNNNSGNNFSGGDDNLDIGNISQDSLNSNVEELNENKYLIGYFHCDKGSGDIIEDISQFELKARVQAALTSNDYENFDDVVWSGSLEEFEPLEFEDKWGRKSPASHSIKFTSILLFLTNFRIKQDKISYLFPSSSSLF